MTKYKNFGPALVQVTFVLLVALLLCPSSRAGDGAVKIGGKALRWGQYKNLSTVIAIEAPGGSLADRIKHYPISGVSAAVCRCQRPGHPFFTPDGKAIIEEDMDRLRSQLDALWKFDMLPIVVLFDPDAACRLESEEAYTAAALTLVNEFGDDFWFLACVSDQCGAPAWRNGTTSLGAVRLARTVAEALHGKDDAQIVAAGSADPDVNARLVENGSAIDAIVARVNELGTVSPGDRPVIELVAASAIDGLALEEAVAQAFGTPAYGFGACFEDAGQGAARDGLLDTLHNAVDVYQRKTFEGSPLDPSDTASLKPGEAEEGFVSMFNGKDLSGWLQLTGPGNFVVKDGVIRLEERTGGWLRSWRPYSDFVFRAEYKIEDGGNSGFYIRTPLVGRQSRIGFEFQVRGQGADEGVDKDSTGSIYDVRPPDGNYIRPGEWNEVEIACIGTHVKIVWNGKVAHDIRYEDIRFMKSRATRGYIGLQDHHDFVEFRNLRIKALD